MKINKTMTETSIIIFWVCACINLHILSFARCVIFSNTTTIEGEDSHIEFLFPKSTDLGTASIIVTFKTARVMSVFPNLNVPLVVDDYKNRTKYTGNTSENIISFLLLNVTSADTGSYEIEKPVSYTVELTVSVPVSNVIIKSLPNDTNPVIVIEYNVKTFKCSTNPIQPVAIIKWYLGGRPMTNATHTTAAVNNNLQISISYLTYTSINSDDQKMLYCTAYNIDSSQTVSSENKTLDIKYGPKNVTISPSEQNYTVIEYIRNIGPIECTATCKPTCNITWSGPGLENHISPILKIINITRNRTGLYQCKATNSHGSNQSLVVNVIVQYAPKGKPIITQSPASIFQAGSITLTCELSGGNPIALLSWDCGMNGTTNSYNTTASYSVSFNVSKVNNGNVCTCSATQSATKYNSKAQHRIIVYYPPDNPLNITQSPDGPIDTDTNITLTCEVAGGNPLAKLEWNCGSNFTNETSGNKASYSSYLQVKSRYNGKICTCSATQQDTSYNATKQHSLVVYYPPSIPAITLNPTLPVFEGNITNADCTVTDSGNPVITTMWIWNQTTFFSLKNETISIGPLTKHDNRGVLSCSVHNEYTNRKGIKRQANKTLDVEYYPIVVLDPNVERKSIIVVEGKTFHIQCLVHGNPQPTAKWFYGDDNVPLLEGKQQLNLTIIHIKRQKKGRYYCKANSTSVKFGNLRRSDYIDLIIHYPPDVNIDYTYNTEKEQEVVFVCNATGIPTNYTYTGWKQTYNGIVIRNSEQLFIHTENNNKKLTLRQLSYKNSGNYTCFVNNGVTGVNEELHQFASKGIFIKGIPELIDTLPADDTFSTRRGGNITIDLRFISFPDITEACWYTKSSNLPIKASVHSNIEVSVEQKTIETTFYDKKVNVSEYGYHAILMLTNLVEQLEGEYILVLRNGFKDKNVTVFVVISSKPDDPSDLNVTKTTPVGMTIAWTRGYSGGHNQYFNVSVYDNTGIRFTQLVKDNYTELTQTFTIIDLRPSTEYVIHLYSQNEIGNSNVRTINTTTDATTTVPEPSKQDFPVGVVVGGVTGVTLACVAIVIIIYIKRRYFIFGKGPESTGRKKLTDDHKDQEEEDGMKDNILYESAGQDFTPQQGTSGVEYAVVTKNKGMFNLNGNKNIQETSLYSEVKKNPRIDQKAEVPTNVVRSKKTKSKEKGKKNEYIEDVYENLSGKGESDTSNNTDQQNINKDGLVYADLVFNPSSNGPMFIHGIDDRTIYADVDTTQKIDPLPDSDEEETTDKPIEVVENR